jgi:predicted alpha-1,6-mannanase (GH76 family)
MVAAGLYERTGEQRWLALARSTYATWRGLMVSHSGQVADHLLPSGEKVLWSFTYNQGAMIGAALALRSATHDDAYLADARLYAGFVLAAQTRQTPFGPVLFDGPSCSGDCDAFKGIAHRNLSDLAAADGAVSGLAALLSADAEAAWSIARDPSSGTFGVDWGARPASPASLASEVSAAAALEAEAARVGWAAGEARRASADP